MTLRDHPKLVVGTCFFLSGICGLIYEVVWARMLGLVFGNTTFAISTILTAFMLGLALGSLIFGRLIDRGLHPVKTYACLEIGIGVYAIFFSRILEIQDKFYFLYQPGSDFMSSSLVLFAFCFLALLIPTILMGGTLPVLIKFFLTDFAGRGETVGRIYALNTVGAVLGSFLSGYFLMLYLGVAATIHLAAAVNILIGLAISALRLTPGPSASGDPPSAPAPDGPASSPNRLLIAALFVSGFTALAYEVAWTRLFALILGSSVYAFSAMLTAFLGGIVLGSYAYAELSGRFKATLALLGIIECVIGAYCLLLIPAFNEIIYWSYLIHLKFSDSFWLLQLMKFFLCFYTIIIPTALFGATFPIAAALYLQDAKTVGGDTGAIYFANTVGSALGSFLTGFLLIPAIGIKNSIVLAVALNLIIGNFLVLGEKSGRRWLPAASVLLLSLALVVQFDRQLLTSGMFMYTYGPDFKQEARADELLYYGEGTSAIVSVHDYADPSARLGNIRYLRVNGKTDASTGKDMSTQLLTGHLPMMLAEKKDRVAVIGLGSGVTAAAVVKYDPHEVYIVEIEKEMLAAADYFTAVNHRVLADPRVTSVITDGRHFIQSSTEKFDIIISEPSNPWIAGIGNLFSDDFYRTVRQRLQPGGVFAQWISADRTDLATFKIMLRTFIVNFPDATLWSCSPGHYLLIAYNGRQPALDSAQRLYTLINQAAGRPAIAADLAAIGIPTAENLWSRNLLDGPAIARMAAGARINSDNRPVLEFMAPRSFYENTVQKNLSEIARYKTR